MDQLCNIKSKYACKNKAYNKTDVSKVYYNRSIFYYVEAHDEAGKYNNFTADNLRVGLKVFYQFI